MRAAAALALALVASACRDAPPAPDPLPTTSPAEAPPIATAPPPATAADSLPTPELDNVGTALGTWTATADAVRFGPPAGAAVFALSCDGATRRVRFARLGRSGEGPMRIVTDNAAATLPARAQQEGIVAELPATDTFLSALAQAERFGVKLGNGRTLALPADPAVRAVIGRCRQP